jgi:hypothetical protein
VPFSFTQDSFDWTGGAIVVQNGVPVEGAAGSEPPRPGDDWPGIAAQDAQLPRAQPPPQRPHEPVGGPATTNTETLSDQDAGEGLFDSFATGVGIGLPDDEQALEDEPRVRRRPERGRRAPHLLRIQEAFRAARYAAPLSAP